MNKQCSNCGNALNGKYCNECGQKAGVHRLSMHDLFHELWHAFTHTDKGILKLIKDLFIAPTSVYDNYYKGQRKKYFSPILFFLVTAGILAYIYPYVFDYEDKVTHQYNEYGRSLSHLTKYRALILLPVEALLLWLVFRARYNFAEIAVFLLFCLGFIYSVRIILFPLYFPLIKHKALLDNVFAYAGYLIIWLHGSKVLARGKVFYIIVMFVLVNLFMIFDTTLQFYLIFGLDLFKHNNAGIHSWLDIVRTVYTW